MNPERLKAWMAELGVLAAEDEAREREAAQRLRLAASELEAAQAHSDAAVLMARSSRNALEKITEQIQRAHPDSGKADTNTEQPPSQRQQEKTWHAPDSVAGVILAFLRDREEASYSEITEQVRRRRPDVVAENCARDLGRMVGRGLLVRPRTGTYRLVAPQDGPMNS
ncbi:MULTISPECIES: hypothetical protein [unclassified Streptomyces]|uniref:hypothetical protein n=1 Tax=unclassified Streptomyces TaxID=2593676 RepID=UPI0009E83D75|nr:hypothetical protein [Streptomyces sp. NRRL WC-3549]